MDALTATDIVLTAYRVASVDAVLAELAARLEPPLADLDAPTAGAEAVLMNLAAAHASGTPLAPDSTEEAALDYLLHDIVRRRALQAAVIDRLPAEARSPLPALLPLPNTYGIAVVPADSFPALADQPGEVLVVGRDADAAF